MLTGSLIAAPAFATERVLPVIGAPEAHWVGAPQGGLAHLGALAAQAAAVLATVALGTMKTAGVLLLGRLRVDAVRDHQGQDLSQHGEQVT